MESFFGHAGAYIVTSLAIWLVFRMVSGIVNRVKLREFDRQMGALFGLAKGVLFCVVITFFAVTLSESLRQMVLKSYSGYAIARLTRNANPILPEDVRAVIGKYIDELDQKLDPDTQPAQVENKAIGQDDLKNGGRIVEQKLEQAGQKIEELGRRVDQKLESLEARRSRLLSLKSLPRSRGAVAASPEFFAPVRRRNSQPGRRSKMPFPCAEYHRAGDNFFGRSRILAGQDSSLMEMSRKFLGDG